MNEIRIRQALKKVPDLYSDFVEMVLDNCKKDRDVYNGIIAFISENPDTTTSDIIEEISHLKGIPYFDAQTQKMVYKYPRFAYKFSIKEKQIEVLHKVLE